MLIRAGVSDQQSVSVQMKSICLARLSNQIWLRDSDHQDHTQSRKLWTSFNDKSPAFENNNAITLLPFQNILQAHDVNDEKLSNQMTHMQSFK